MAVKEKKTKAQSTKKGSETKQALIYAGGEQCFWARDGHILASLYDLEHALSCIEKDIYLHHVTPERNDFADWVEFVLLDIDCANNLRKVRGQKSAHACVVKALGRYQE